MLYGGKLILILLKIDSKENKMQSDLIESLVVKTDSKIVLLLMDGLGDIPAEGYGTPLEEAVTPNLDRLAKEGTLGQFDPIAPGVTPGSGPAHLSLFGYDPVNTMSAGEYSRLLESILI